MTERMMGGFLNRILDQINPLGPFLLGAGLVPFMPKTRRNRATMKGKGHIHMYLIMAPEVGYGSPPTPQREAQEMNL